MLVALPYLQTRMLLPLVAMLRVERAGVGAIITISGLDGEKKRWSGDILKEKNLAKTKIDRET